MIIQIFLINLKTAIQHRRKSFNTPYNEEVIKLIPTLVSLNLIQNVRKNPLRDEKRILIYLPLELTNNSWIKLVNMCSRKKKRTWPATVLFKKAQRNQTYILKTSYGYQTSHFCIKKRIGGKTIARIGY